MIEVLAFYFVVAAVFSFGFIRAIQPDSIAQVLGVFTASLLWFPIVAYVSFFGEPPWAT